MAISREDKLMAEVTIRFSDKTLKLFGATLAALLLLWGSFRLLTSDLLKAKYENHLFFPETQGLRAGAPVRLDGMDVGKVAKVNLASTSKGPKQRVEAILRVETQYQQAIPADSGAFVVNEGLLGNSYVNIARGTSEVALSPGQEIRAIPVENVSFMEMIEALGKIRGCNEERETTEKPKTSAVPKSSPGSN